MIPSNVIQRVFQLRHGDITGTCFAIDIGGKQYLATARHCVAGLSINDTVDIFHEDTWKSIGVNLVGHGAGDIDVSVLAPGRQLSAAPPLPASTANLFYGQDVYFLGFPFGLSSESGDLNGGFPFPLVKKATLSAIDIGPDRVMMLDGLNNPGFSGGPVVYASPKSPNRDYATLGVISGYRSHSIPVEFENTTTRLTVRENTGIIIAYSIVHVLNLIEDNPVGFVLS